MKVVPSGKPLGAEILDLDLKRIDDDAFAPIYRAWLGHQVLLFRGQDLSDEDLLAFSRRFGELEWAPVQESGRRFVTGHPEIYVVSNVVENGIPIGSLGAGEAIWHTDMSYLEYPPKASMLYALEIPPEGGNTYFCSMYHAYESLPESLRRRIAGFDLKHDATYNSGGYVREGTVETNDPLRAPGRYHPLICVHPETGRRLLYLGRRRNAYIDGLDIPQSERLLDEIWSCVGADESIWGNVWEKGDLVLWDNRCTMHRRDAFDADSRRILHRTQIKGDRRPSRGPL